MEGYDKRNLACEQMNSGTTMQESLVGLSRISLERVGKSEKKGPDPELNPISTGNSGRVRAGPRSDGSDKRSRRDF